MLNMGLGHGSRFDEVVTMVLFLAFATIYIKKFYSLKIKPYAL